MNPNAQAFLDVLRENGVTNPFALAAHYATGQAESGWSDRNLTRTWDDPSESGRPGTSGGAFSWRNERLQALQQFASNRPGGLADVRNHAHFWLQENPQLIKRLNSAESVQDAMRIMNSNIQFAGWNRPNNEETQARLASAQSFLGQAQTGAVGSSPESRSPTTGAQSQTSFSQHLNMTPENTAPASRVDIQSAAADSPSTGHSESNQPDPRDSSASPRRHGTYNSSAPTRSTESDGPQHQRWAHKYMMPMDAGITPMPSTMKTPSNPTGVPHGFDPSALNRASGEVDAMREEQARAQQMAMRQQQQPHPLSQSPLMPSLPPNQNNPASSSDINSIIQRLLG